MMKINDNVNHPNHYCEGRKYEPKDVAEDWGLIEDAYLYSALKYISRGGRKLYPGMDARQSKIMDLRKARQYLDFDIDYLERKQSIKSDDSDDSIYELDDDIDD